MGIKDTNKKDVGQVVFPDDERCEIPTLLRDNNYNVGQKEGGNSDEGKHSDWIMSNKNTTEFPKTARLISSDIKIYTGWLNAISFNLTIQELRRRIFVIIINNLIYA